MNRPLVAIVGRPNVGKSTLFNRLVGYRKAIVYDRPGVTRDRNIAPITIDDIEIDLMDTGGFEFQSKEIMGQLVNQQILKGLEESTVMLLVLDGKYGVTSADDQMVNKLRAFGKPILAVVNKVDTRVSDTVSQEFYKYGFETLIPVSSEHGIGFDELKEIIVEHCKKFSTEPKEEEQVDKPVRMAFVGRPNVGKSSIINALINEERLTVSEIAGTTRDTIDIAFEKEDQKFVLLDTAGMRYKRKVDDDVEYYSIKRTFEAIELADVVFLVTDASEQLTTQDQKIASKVIERRKGLCILVNKWDLAPKGDKVKENYRKDFYAYSPFLHFADSMFISAKTHMGMDKILKMAKQITHRLRRTYEEEELREAYQKISTYHHEVGNAGFHLMLKGLYVNTGNNMGPIFRIKCNKPHRVSETYKRYWENALIDYFQLRNVAIKVIFSATAKGASDRDESEKTEADQKSGKKPGNRSSKQAGKKPQPKKKNQKGRNNKQRRN
jgi:GTP-binding protein